MARDLSITLDAKVVGASLIQSDGEGSLAEITVEQGRTRTSFTAPLEIARRYWTGRIVKVTIEPSVRDESD